MKESFFRICHIVITLSTYTSTNVCRNLCVLKSLSCSWNDILGQVTYKYKNCFGSWFGAFSQNRAAPLFWAHQGKNLWYDKRTTSLNERDVVVRRGCMIPVTSGRSSSYEVTDGLTCKGPSLSHKGYIYYLSLYCAS